MSLFNIIKNLNLSNTNQQNLDRTQLYSSIKLISNYIKGETSKFTKSELIQIISGLNFYLENKLDNNTRKINFKSQSIELDDEQHKILVSPPNQNQRIIAGAGSGKTTTILCRVKYLLDNFICPDRILILTFNRDSAQNIRSRIDDLFGFPVQLNIYTIDAFCCKLMYAYGETSNATKAKAVKSLSEYSAVGLEIMKLYGKEISTQFVHIFFDEFQDVNDIQFRILKLFVDHNSTLTVIGDDCQNIYQFRGTNNYYMVNFDIIVPNSHTYKLTTNYRSTKLIVDMANDSIEWNANRVEKTMKASKSVKSHLLDKIKPKLVVCGSDISKYEYIVKKIAKLIELGFTYGDIAILSRNTYPLKCMETELTKNSIPHVALITDKNADDTKKLIDPEKIALTTIHKSKGLEFSIVFIIGVSHDHFPEHLNNNIKNIEEERRLFYVGITRTKQYLFMLGSVNEIPLSVFVNEVKSHIQISYYKTDRKYSREELFNSTDTETTLKLVYGVNELIGSLQSEDYGVLRKKNLILDCSPEVQTIFDAKLQWSEQIKKGAFEPDFGEYVDRYITRGICAKLGQDFIDTDTEFIIQQDDNSIHNVLVDKVNENKIEPELLTNLGLKLKHLDKIKSIQDKIKFMVKKMQEQNMIRKFTYPSNIIQRIKIAYQRVQDISKSNDDKEIEEDIYWISLCRNFRLERTRLAYKNIYLDMRSNFYMGISNITSSPNILTNPTTNTIKSRGDFYINKYGSLTQTNYPKCKISLEHKFKNKQKKTCSILGELDIIVWDEKKKTWTLVDFKCSESEFRLEWEIQLLTYYSLIRMLDIYSDLEIGQIGIINLMDGKEYYMDIPNNYDFIELIDYFEEKIQLDQLSIRPKPELDYIIQTNTSNQTNSITQINTSNLQNQHHTITFNSSNKSKSKSNKHIMVLDTETTDFAGDIIQLAWIIYDLSTNKIIKKSNIFVKDRIPILKSQSVHNISLDKLRTDGVEFYQLMTEFVKDLETVNTIVGHNISFDLRMIINNLRKFNINIIDGETKNHISNIFDTHNIECTKKLSGGKSLEKLYLELFGEKFLGAHDAMVDVESTLACYLQLIELKKQNIKSSQIDFIV